MSVLSWRRQAEDLTKQVRELQADLAAMTADRDEQAQLREDAEDSAGACAHLLDEAREEVRKWEWCCRESVHLNETTTSHWSLEQVLARYQPAPGGES